MTSHFLTLNFMSKFKTSIKICCNNRLKLLIHPTCCDFKMIRSFWSNNKIIFKVFDDSQSFVKSDSAISVQPACVISQTGRCYCSSSKYPVALLFFLLIMSPAAFCMSLTIVQDVTSC